MAAPTQERIGDLDLERPIMQIGTDLAARMPRPRAVSTARVERRMQELLMSDPALRAALFRFVDVRPACATPADVTRHLHELLADAQADSGHARRAANITGRKLATRPVAAIAATGVKQMAQRFIVGADAKDSLPTITALWKQRRRRDRRPARRGHGHRGRGRPLRRSAARTRCARSPPRPRSTRARRRPR